MKVAVITPYHCEPLEVLRRCHSSVLAQTHDCRHFLIGDGARADAPLEWDAEHLLLPRAHSDNGNTPRGIGAVSAKNHGYDAIAFLDADNWFHPLHIETLVKIHQASNAPVCVATRNIHREDGSFMYTDTHDSNGISHVDTSCLFLTREAFDALHVWTSMPKQLAPVCDRVFWNSLLARKFPIARCTTPTVAFTTRYEAHYSACGEAAPKGSKLNETTTHPCYQWWDQLDEGSRHYWVELLGAGP